MALALVEWVGHSIEDARQEIKQPVIALSGGPIYSDIQKLAVTEYLDEFGKGSARSQPTDFSGALMLCSDYLKASRPGTRVKFV